MAKAKGWDKVFVDNDTLPLFPASDAPEPLTQEQEDDRALTMYENALAFGHMVFAPDE